MSDQPSPVLARVRALLLEARLTGEIPDRATLLRRFPGHQEAIARIFDEVLGPAGDPDEGAVGDLGAPPSPEVLETPPEAGSPPARIVLELGPGDREESEAQGMAASAQEGAGAFGSDSTGPPLEAALSVGKATAGPDPGHLELQRAEAFAWDLGPEPEDVEVADPMSPPDAVDGPSQPSSEPPAPPVPALEAHPSEAAGGREAESAGSPTVPETPSPPTESDLQEAAGMLPQIPGARPVPAGIPALASAAVRVDRTSSSLNLRFWFGVILIELALLLILWVIILRY